MPRSNHYVNGTTASEADPLRIDELGMTKEQVEQRKTNRRLLFTGITISLVLILTVFVTIVMEHQDAGEVSPQVPQDSDSAQNDQSTSVSTSGLFYKLNRDTAKNSNVIQPGCESTVIIIRHCEKVGPSVPDKDDNVHCSYVGHERAHFIPTLFGTENHGWPVPATLYALSQNRESWLNFREIETLEPLASKFGLEINSQFTSNEDVVKDYFRQLATGSMCGKVALLSWKHELMGDLAELFGCPDCPSSYPEDSHDEVWQLKFVYQVLKTNVRLEKSFSSSEEPTPDMSNEGGRRQLRKKHKHHHSSDAPWSVFFSRTYQNFDPLKFSYSVGDYDGSPSGGHWMTQQNEEM